jgi:hypothetical protein
MRGRLSVGLRASFQSLPAWKQFDLLVLVLIDSLTDASRSEAASLFISQALSAPHVSLVRVIESSSIVRFCSLCLLINVSEFFSLDQHTGINKADRSGFSACF